MILASTGFLPDNSKYRSENHTETALPEKSSVSLSALQRLPSSPEYEPLVLDHGRQESCQSSRICCQPPRSRPLSPCWYDGSPTMEPSNGPHSHLRLSSP